MALIFYSSSQSDPAPALTHFIWDKALHSAGYAFLAFLYARALNGEGFNAKVTLLAAVILTSIYGASDEFHQYFTPMRTPDLTDWLADSTGGAMGAVAYAIATLPSSRLRRFIEPPIWDSSSNSGGNGPQ
jgi:VanZ family protein